jgi:ribosomal protein L37E
MSNSTIINKKKRCKSCGKIDYIFSKGECKQCAIVSTTQKRVEKYELEQGIEQDESLQNLINDLDVVFSRYIRIKYSDNDGNSECFTCGKKEHYTTLQCGHFIPRANLGTRFLQQNCRPQCKTCNEYKDGNIEEYTIRLENENNGITDWLAEQSRQVYKPTRDEIKQMLFEYRHKLNLVKTKLK